MVDEIFNKFNASKMGVDSVGQICIMLHCGSRGLGHQVATGMYMYIHTFINLCNLASTSKHPFLYTFAML